MQSSKGAVIPFGSPLIFIMFVVNYKAIHGLGKKEEGGEGGVRGVVGQGLLPLVFTMFIVLQGSKGWELVSPCVGPLHVLHICSCHLARLGGASSHWSFCVHHVAEGGEDTNMA